MQKEQRVAIVTGGTRGMGLAISKQLLKDGKKVAAIYRSDAESAKKASEEFSGAAIRVGTAAGTGGGAGGGAETETEVGTEDRAGSDHMVVQADVSKKEDALDAAKKVAAEWGRIDILVNNAGIFDFSFIEDMSEEFFDRMIAVNLKSQIFMVQAVLPYMKKQKFGRIVGAGSISGELADVGLTAYAATKAGVNMLTKIACGELAPYGITVNAFAPGIVHTDMTDAMIKERGDKQLKQIPLGYFGTIEEVGSLVGFLCSDEASYVTGEIIGIDGGMMKVQNPYRAYEKAGEAIESS